MRNRIPIFLSKSSPSFTLIELIVVIIIVGILAAVGMTQYTLIVEKARTVEAKIRIGAMRQLVYQYYLENGSLTGMTNAYLGVDNTCVSTDFYRYNMGIDGSSARLYAARCTSDGKTPNTSNQYIYYLVFDPATGQNVWHCVYTSGPACFGLPS
jgi:prepilin-type N-terminal cleavage/methylation domain-containing protein